MNWVQNRWRMVKHKQFVLPSMYVKYYLREREGGREGRAPRRERKEKETEQQLPSSFIPSLTMWLKTKCETFKLPNQQITASPTVQKVWQLADHRCIHMLSYRPWSISAPRCLQTLWIDCFSLLLFCWSIASVCSCLLYCCTAERFAIVALLFIEYLPYFHCLLFKVIIYNLIPTIFLVLSIKLIWSLAFKTASAVR